MRYHQDSCTKQDSSSNRCPAECSVFRETTHVVLKTQQLHVTEL